MTLSDIKPGATCTVVKLRDEGATRRRIMDMGITKGAQIRVDKVAPLGDPVDLTVRGYHLSRRKSDLDKIEVQAVEPLGKTMGWLPQPIVLPSG